MADWTGVPPNAPKIQPGPAAGPAAALKRLRYPAGWDAGSVAAADQRDARARGCAAQLAAAAARTVLAGGYDPADPAVLMKLAADHGTGAARAVYGGCVCSRHMTGGALFLASALALRVAQLEADLADARGGAR